MAAKFQMVKTDSGYSFNLFDSKGDLLLIGGEFPSSQEAEKAIADVRVGSLMSQQIAAGKTPAGDSFFVIKDSNGQIIAKSELYAAQMVFDDALHQVKDHACVAEISGMDALSAV